MATQEEINVGQREINGALCYVDWNVIETLEALIKALTNRKVLSREDLEEIYKPFKKAYYMSPKVAGIDPPGCDQPPFAHILESGETKIKAA